MRRLRRPGVSLPTFRRGGPARSATARLVTQFRSDGGAPSRFQDDLWKRPEVRGALLAMHGPVCAWCQRSLKGEPGEVEHFRPKSLYWWLAYDFNNYLLSCPICNKRKWASFPLLDGRPCTWSQRKRLHEERTALLDPVVDDVEMWLQVRRHNGHYRLILVDSPSVDVVQRRRAEATLELFKWNDDPRLVTARKEAIEKAFQAADDADEGDLSQLAEVKRLASRFQPFGVAIRQVFEEHRPDLLPSPTEELHFFVEHLAERLSEVRELLLENPGNELAQCYEEEILWALAVLWKDPPYVSPGEIGLWLERLSCRNQVSAVLARL